MATLTAGQLQRELSTNNQLALVDVRERWEYNDGHIPGSALIPLGHLSRRGPLALPDWTAPVVLISGTGDRAARAAKWLLEHGYKAARFLEGGFDAWLDAGLCRETGWGVPGKRIGEAIAHAFGDLELGPDYLTAVVDQTLIVDIRPRWEHSQGHVPGAINIPGEALAGRVEDLRALMAASGYTRVVTHCAGRTRGLLAAARLREQGLDSAYALRNGCMGWMLQGGNLAYGQSDDPFRRPEAVGDFTQFTGPRMNLAELQQLIAQQEPFYLLDLRGREAFVAGHLPDAIPLGAGQLALEADLWIAQPWVRIVLCADNGLQASWAASLLERMGFRTPSLLEGRPTDWPDQLVSRLEELTVWMVLYARSIAAEKSLDSDDFLIIDVRSQGEWSIGHIEGSRCIPFGILHRHVEDLMDTGKPLVLVSMHGVRAGDAAQLLSASGLDHSLVRILEGGLVDWVKNGGQLIIDQPDMRYVTKDSGGRLSRAVWARPFEKELRQAMVAYLAWEESLVAPDSK